VKRPIQILAPILASLVLLASIPGQTAAAEVTVGIGLSLSPYVFPNERRGMEYDIVKEALAREGHTMVPVFLPLGRVLKEVETGQVAAAMTQRPGMSSGTSLSDVYITYRNFAISLDSRNLDISRLEDLADKSVLAFQKANVYLGPDYRKVVEDNARYREEADQVVQPLLLFLGRVDVVIADSNIFSWFASRPEVRAKVDTTQPLRYAPLFPPTQYRMAFRDPKLRDDFNRGLAELRASGDYDRILARYAAEMITKPLGVRQ
jgi:polar amino acid transport system substrate-binding protein